MKKSHNVKVGDIIYPYIYRYIHSEITQVENIVVFFHRGKNYYGTTIWPAPDVEWGKQNNNRIYLSDIKYVGWCNPDVFYGNGLKVFLPNLKFRFNKETGRMIYRFKLEKDDAIEVTKVSFKSVEGKIIKLSIK